MQKVRFETANESIKNYVVSENDRFGLIKNTFSEEKSIVKLFNIDNTYFNSIVMEYIHTIYSTNNNTINCIINPKDIKKNDQMIAFADADFIGDVFFPLYNFSDANIVIIKNVISIIHPKYYNDPYVSANIETIQIIFYNNEDAMEYSNLIRNVLEDVTFITHRNREGGDIVEYNKDVQAIINLQKNIELYPITMNGKESYNIITGEKVIMLENGKLMKTYMNSEEFGCRLFLHYVEDSMDVVENIFPEYKGIMRDETLSNLIEDND